MGKVAFRFKEHGVYVCREACPQAHPPRYAIF
jgi:hypothetical protein